jgi:hypothetical protein
MMCQVHYSMTMYCLCPSFLIVLFGSLTLKNLRQHRCVIPVTGEINQTAQRTDTQILPMLAAQVFVTIISTLPFSTYQLYVPSTSSFSKNTLQIAQENLVARTVGTMTYFAHSNSFYLYTLTDTVFRKELFKIIRRCWRLDRNISVSKSLFLIFISAHKHAHQWPQIILFQFASTSRAHSSHICGCQSYLR